MNDYYYNNTGAICPHCRHNNLAIDSDGILYDESLCEYECSNCGKEFSVSVHCEWTWTTGENK